MTMSTTMSAATLWQDWLAKRYYAWRRFLPARLLYHPDYFRVQAMLAAGADAAGTLARQRLRRILADALAHVPHYRHTVPLDADAALHEPLEEVLACFPYLTKGEVMADRHAFLDARVDPRTLLYATSGGSSGQGIGIWRSKRLADIEKAFFAHEWSRFGGKCGDKFGGDANFSFDKSRILRIGADARRLAHESPARVVGNRLLLSPYHVGPPHKAAILDALRRFRPRYVHAYPSSAAALAELLDGDGAGLDMQVEAVLLASEPATPEQLAAIGRLFGCPISINYGLSERTNLAFARHDGGVTSDYLFQPLYGWGENRIDDDGRRAEIVGTSLWNDVMPLIRYRTGDYGLIDGQGRCAAIDGRGQEFLVDRAGRHIPGLSIVIDEATWDFVRLYQVRQQRPGEITLAVVPRHGRLSHEQRTFVLAAQQRRWGGLFDIVLQEESDIPLAPNGKRKLVVNALCA
jgi:phenylacetate-CoA ligase